MANATRGAILRALIDGAITDLMVRTNVYNVCVDDSTTLAAKLSELITSLNSKATQQALTEGLNARPTTEQMNSAISAAISELINGAPAAYDTLKELADAINQLSGGNVDYGKENAGKLLYVGADGFATGLTLGAGLAIVNGILTITTQVVTSAICGQEVCGNFICGGM